MEISFDTKRLRTICESDVYANHELGLRVSELLKRRLADLRAATSIKDLVAGQPRILDEANRQNMVINLSDGYGIVYCANHIKNPMTETGGIDWAKVSRIKILRIGKINDNKPRFST